MLEDFIKINYFIFFDGPVNFSNNFILAHNMALS